MSEQWSWAQCLVFLSGIAWGQRLDFLSDHWSDAVFAGSLALMSVAVSASTLGLMSGHPMDELKCLSEDHLLPLLELLWELLWDILSELL
jgi:hypothetical protein